MIEHSEYPATTATESVHLDDASNPLGNTCVHCDVQIGQSADMSLHADYCPYTTGLWFVKEAVLTFRCDSCDKEHQGQLVCPRCNRFFEVGDPYRLVDDATQLVVPWVAAPATATAICAQCADTQIEALMERYG